MSDTERENQLPTDTFFLTKVFNHTLLLITYANILVLQKVQLGRKQKKSVICLRCLIMIRSFQLPV